MSDSASALTIKGLAQVQDDGSLVVDGRDVVLFGIDIPLFDRDCQTLIRPAQCAPRSVLVLKSIVEGFVHCQTVGRQRSWQLTVAVCTIRGRRMSDPRIDIGAQMLLEGWAFVSVNAPSRYRSLERLAQTRESGMWSRGITRFR